MKTILSMMMLLWLVVIFIIIQRWWKQYFGFDRLRSHLAHNEWNWKARGSCFHSNGHLFVRCWSVLFRCLRRSAGSSISSLDGSIAIQRPCWLERCAIPCNKPCRTESHYLTTCVWARMELPLFFSFRAQEFWPHRQTSEPTGEVRFSVTETSHRSHESRARRLEPYCTTAQ